MNIFWYCFFFSCKPSNFVVRNKSSNGKNNSSLQYSKFTHTFCVALEWKFTCTSKSRKQRTFLQRIPILQTSSLCRTNARIGMSLTDSISHARMNFSNGLSATHFYGVVSTTCRIAVYVCVIIKKTINSVVTVIFTSLRGFQRVVQRN